MGYRIGSFNLRNLSFSAKDEELGDEKMVRRNYAEIGKIIRDNFDIVALQEVKTKNVLQLLFPMGLNWDYTPKPSNDNNEEYVFAWNTRKLRPVTEPHIWKQYPRDPELGRLLRDPFYGRFTPSGDGLHGPFVELRLINTHIRFKPKENKEIPLSNSGARLHEFLILTRQILSRLEDKRYGDYMPAYTILLGDYNLNLNTSYLPEKYIYVENSSHQKQFITVQDKPTTLKSSFDGYANNYDHFTYNEQYFDERGIKMDANSIDTVNLYCGGDFEKHWREISDHIPIILNIDFK